MPKELSTHDGLGTRDAARLEQYVRSFQFRWNQKNDSGRCIGQKSCKASRINVRKHDPAEKREVWIAITLQIEHDAHAPTQKMVQNACVQISNMKEKHTKRGTLETSMYECGDERPRVAISGDTLF